MKSTFIFIAVCVYQMLPVTRSEDNYQNVHKGIAEFTEVIIDLTFTEDGARIQFSAFDEEIELSLSRVSAADFMAENLPVTIMGDDNPQTLNLNFKQHGIEFYEEVSGRGTFSIQYLPSDGISYTLEGVTLMGSYEVIVTPTPREDNHTIGNFLQSRKHTIHRYPLKSARGSKNHQRVDNSLYNIQKRFLFGLQDHIDPIPGNVNAKVEVLVWTDFSYINSFLHLVNHPHVERDILKYVATVIHAGNKIYQNGIKDPSLNISVFLTGAVICKSADCSRFTSELLHNGTVENHRALDLFAETLASAYTNHTLMFHYDYAVAFTRYDLIDANGTPIGVSFTDDICSIVDGKSSSIIEDQGGYSCIGTFVHELAHTLGCDHDGWFRGQKCNPINGYIMAAISPLTTNGFYFSQCSINSMKSNLINKKASCVMDEPHINHHYADLTGDMPGQIYNASEQCRQIYGTSFCLSVGTTLEDICHKMYCWDPFLANVCSTKSSAAPGTSCGQNKWCANGECILDDRAP